MIKTILLLVFSFLTTLIGVEVWRRFALRRQHLDIPNERSSHHRPIPRGGGFIIFVVTIGFLFLWTWRNDKLEMFAPILFGAIVIAIVSYLDDIYTLPSVLRFGIHALGAVLAIRFLGYFHDIPLPIFGSLDVDPITGQILTAIWVVGLTNAYNFMDGIDGIAGIQGFIAGIGWCAIGLITQDQLVSIFGALIASTCAGFLWHNWHPARIFMGDVGAAFLGYSLAVMPLIKNQKHENPSLWAVVGVLLVWTFVFDTVFTFIRRALRRENVFAAHRSHLYQRLIIKGLRHDTVTLYYGFLAFIGALLAIFLLIKPTPHITISLLPLFCLLLWLSVFLVEKLYPRKVLPESDLASKSTQTS